MSRGKSRHQASRRRMYSTRQRELRERRMRAANDEQPWLGDQVAAIEIEESLDFEAPNTPGMRLQGRASAA
jgi:hypothetical protein